jgi:hypothetical protein
VPPATPAASHPSPRRPASGAGRPQRSEWIPRPGERRRISVHQPRARRPAPAGGAHDSQIVNAYLQAQKPPAAAVDHDGQRRPRRREPAPGSHPRLPGQRVDEEARRPRKAPPQTPKPSPSPRTAPPPQGGRPSPRTCPSLPPRDAQEPTPSRTPRRSAAAAPLRRQDLEFENRRCGRQSPSVRANRYPSTTTCLPPYMP